MIQETLGYPWSPFFEHALHAGLSCSWTCRFVMPPLRLPAKEVRPNGFATKFKRSDKNTAKLYFNIAFPVLLSVQRIVVSRKIRQPTTPLWSLIEFVSVAALRLQRGRYGRSWIVFLPWIAAVHSWDQSQIPKNGYQSEMLNRQNETLQWQSRMFHQFAQGWCPSLYQTLKGGKHPIYIREYVEENYQRYHEERTRDSRGTTLCHYWMCRFAGALGDHFRF